MIDKAQELDADMIFLDLEDSVSPTEKVAARSQVADSIRDGDWGERVMCVRVNDWSTPWTLGDLTSVVIGAGDRLDEIMIPKVENASMVQAIDLILGQLEQEAGLPAGHIGIEVQIETAKGVINVEEICAASPRLEAVTLGPIDLSASLEMPTLEGGIHIAGYPGDHFHYVFMKLLMAGRANGIQVIDGPYVKIKDLDGCREYSQRSYLLGYDGKWALHPTQIDVLNTVFSPSQELFERALAIVEAYEAAVTTNGRGAAMLGGEMVDEASRKAAGKTIERGKRAGLGK